MTITQQATALVTHLVDRGATRIAIGRGHSPEIDACATSLIDAWELLGGQVATIVEWASPPTPHTRVDTFMSSEPDAWVIADTARSWGRLAPLFIGHPRWEPARTLGFAGLGRQGLLSMTPPHSLEGLSGVTADGRWWRIRGDAVVTTVESPAVLRWSA